MNTILLVSGISIFLIIIVVIIYFITKSKSKPDDISSNVLTTVQVPIQVPPPPQAPIIPLPQPPLEAPKTVPTLDPIILDNKEKAVKVSNDASKSVTKSVKIVIEDVYKTGTLVDAAKDAAKNNELQATTPSQKNAAKNVTDTINNVSNQVTILSKSAEDAIIASIKSNKAILDLHLEDQKKDLDIIKQLQSDFNKSTVDYNNAADKIYLTSTLNISKYIDDYKNFTINIDKYINDALENIKKIESGKNNKIIKNAITDITDTDTLQSLKDKSDSIKPFYSGNDPSPGDRERAKIVVQKKREPYLNQLNRFLDQCL